MSAPVILYSAVLVCLLNRCEIDGFLFKQHRKLYNSRLHLVLASKRLPVDIRNNFPSILSLDNSVIPSYVLTRSTKIMITAAVFLFGIVLATLTEEDEAIEQPVVSSRKDITSNKNNISKSSSTASKSKSNSTLKDFWKAADFLNAARLMWNIAVAKFTLIFEVVREMAKDALNLDTQEKIDLKEWSICELEKREALFGPYARYRFNLPTADSVLPLYVGQELVLCSIDSEKDTKVVKDSFFPVSPPTAKGYFDIIVSADESSSQLRFIKALKSLNIGDEIAFKGGAYRLRYEGKDDPISFMSFFASGVGISAALQILRSVLPEGDSTVVDTELLWINESVDEYVCEREVESLEYRFIEKCSVTRIVQRDLYHGDIGRNKQVFEAVAPYERGRLAVVCAPSYLVSKARQMYVDKGYPNANILSIGL